MDEGDRTLDTRSHNPVLYQLSYAHHIAFACARARNGAPGRTRTCDHPLRRRMLYPTELRALYLHSVRSADFKAPALEEVTFFESHLTQQQAVLDKRGECYRGSKHSSTAISKKFQLDKGVTGAGSRFAFATSPRHARIRALSKSSPMVNQAS